MCLSHRQVKSVVTRRYELDSATANAIASMLMQDRRATTKRSFDTYAELKNHLDYMEDLESEA